MSREPLTPEQLARIERVNRREEAFLARAIKVNIGLGAALTLVLLLVRFDWGFGFGAGLFVSMALMNLTKRYAYGLQPGSTARHATFKLLLYAALKYAGAAVVIYFTVRLGIGAAACFCIGFGLVYLVLVFMSIASLKDLDRDDEER